MRQQILRVLDIASSGTAAKGYELHFRPAVPRIEIKALARMSIEDLRESRMNGKIIRLEKKPGILPECLKSEPSEYYDHVHFHMASPRFTEPGANETLAQVKRIARRGATLFFCVDGTFFSSEYNAHIKEIPNLPAEFYLDKALSGAFSVAYRFYFAENDLVIPPAMTAQAKEISWMFGMGIACNKDSAAKFFSFFSEYANFGQYFAIAVKSGQ